MSEAKDARLLLVRLLDHDGDAQVHERLGKVNHPLPLRQDCQGSYRQVSLLEEEDVEKRRKNMWKKKKRKKNRKKRKTKKKRKKIGEGGEKEEEEEKEKEEKEEKEKEEKEKR